jgi:acetyl-CoA C-acetyltransferase
MGALGLHGPGDGDSRPLTVTGGLGFAGGPANNYPTHAIAGMVDTCRRDPGSLGMVTALGWYATKHSIGVYSTTAPEHGFVRADGVTTQAVIDALPGREIAGAYSGPATVEATAVVFEREGAPAVAIVSALTPDGRRALANTRDRSAMQDMTEKAWEGRNVTLRTDGTVNTLDA